MARYDAKDRESMKVKLAPWQALAMAASVKRFVRAEVERAMHVNREGIEEKAMPHQLE